jgi:hypothetical protein
MTLQFAGGRDKYEAGTADMVIDVNGNVGIGTDSPDALLHLSGGSTEKIIIEDSSNPRGNYIGMDGSDNLVIAADEDNLGASSNIQFRIDASEKMKLDNTGRLLIGQDSGDEFNADSMLRLQRTGDRVFQQFKVDADQEASILFGDVDDDVECSITYQAANQNLIFSTGNNDEAVRVLSTGGITFNGDTATANALDDYEEGTWRPTIAGQTSAGTYTYGENAGVYTKIGNQVTCTFYIVDITEVSAGSGNLAIDNFPFSAANVTAGTNMDYYWGACTLEHFNVNNSTVNIAVGMDAGSTRCLFWETIDGTSNGLVAITDLSSSGAADIWGQVTYRTT